MATPEQSAHPQAYNEESRVPELYWLYSIAIALSVTTTVLRLFAKRSVNHGIWLDDYLAVFTTLCICVQAATVFILAIPHGLGRHYVALRSIESLTTVIKAWYVGNVFVVAAICAVKLAVLAFFYRALPSPTFRKFIVAAAIFFVTWSSISSGLMIFMCVPVRKIWQPEVEGHCVNKTQWSFVTNVLNIVSDFWIFLMPLPVLWSLQLDWKRKMLLCTVFSIGLGVCALTILRTFAFRERDSSDVPWYLARVMPFYTYEPVGALLCINVPLIARASYVLISSRRPSPGNSYGQRIDPEAQHRRRPSNWLRGIDSIRLTGLTTKRGSLLVHEGRWIKFGPWTLSSSQINLTKIMSTGSTSDLGRGSVPMIMVESEPPVADPRIREAVMGAPIQTSDASFMY